MWKFPETFFFFFFVIFAFSDSNLKQIGTEQEWSLIRILKIEFPFMLFSLLDHLKDGKKESLSTFCMYLIA